MSGGKWQILKLFPICLQYYFLQFQQKPFYLGGQLPPSPSPTSLYLPIIIGVPWVWKWCSSSRPFVAISAPLLTYIIFDVTSIKCSKHMLTSKEPIHCLEPTKFEFLSPMSTSACWISLWLGTGLEVYPWCLNHEQMVCKER